MRNIGEYLATWDDPYIGSRQASQGKPNQLAGVNSWASICPQLFIIFCDRGWSGVGRVMMAVLLGAHLEELVFGEEFVDWFPCVVWMRSMPGDPNGKAKNCSTFCHFDSKKGIKFPDACPRLLSNYLWVWVLWSLVEVISSHVRLPRQFLQNLQLA